MKILRLELFGFKSFKDKTIITFDQPITAIVGSNGCGKSNVVDALYWVMGDMSPKHLRGSHMSDVIFSGSRDAAALDLAEVTLVLERDPENDPELPPQFQGSNEIQITRRYYRSGESECFINKVSCRLRDIQEFFMDTGLGAKAYSIIEQGAIMRMVTQKPEERRSVIEEVAGIMKFKARKAETERKLEHAQSNLTRIDDIVKDLQKQLGTLKRQAEKAEKFRVMSDELRHLEIRLATREWTARNEDRSTASITIADMQQRHETALATFEIEKVNVETQRQTLSESELELDLKREQSRELELALKDTEAKLATFEARKEQLSRRLGQDRLNLEDIQTREGALREELAQLEERLGEVKAESDAFHEEANTAAALAEEIRTRSDEIRREVESARKELHAQEISETRLTQQIQESQRNLSQLKSREDSLKLQLANLETEHEIRNGERQSMLDYLEVAFSKRSDLESEKTEVDAELARLEKDRGEFQIERDEIKRELTGVQVRQEQLEHLQKDLEGVNATSRVMAFKLREDGVTQNLLADVIQAPVVLEKAVEAVLGRNLQRVLAPNFETVAELQNVLANSTDKEARRGRASLWLSDLSVKHASRQTATALDAIYLSIPAPTTAAAAATATELSEESPGPDGLVATTEATPATETAPLLTAQDYLLSHPQVVGPLTQLIRNESAEKEAPWLELFKDFWVVRSREDFSELGTALAGLPLNFVTLDGDILTQEGYLDLAPAEASKEQSVGLVQRKREILELGTRAEVLDAKLLRAQNKLNEANQAYLAAKEKFQDLTARLSALNPDVEKHSSLLRQVEAQVARLLEKQSLLGEELERSQNGQAEVSEKLEIITQEVAQSTEAKALLATALENAQQKLETVRQEQLTCEENLRNVQRSAKEVDRQLSDLRARKAAGEQEQSLSVTRQTQITEEIARLETEIGGIEEHFNEEMMVREEQALNFKEASEGVSVFARTVEQQKEAAREAQRTLEKLSSELQVLAVAMKDVEQAVAINEVELKNISARIFEHYQITLETLNEEQMRELLAPSDLEELADPETGKQRATTLRQRIENLGKINMVAIEEFAEISKRHEYLFIQRQDVADGISQLRDAIDKIDRESRHRFAEAYTAVNEAFKKTFPILFGGGNAELRLTLPDNLLETGVEIVAQPPGKKLQSVTLLSGGEKALTAVSLIFGIFSIKPSPFCVLDEVDAPLDDSNVNRFNTQVRRMAETSQMILITHHKKTMESCDALFGVTMEEPGISKVASARLGELRTA